MKHALCAPIVSWIAMTVFLSGCYRPKVDEPDELKQLFESYFHGIETKDHKKIIDATTDDFVLFEMGRVWNNDSVFINIDRNLPFEVRYTFRDYKIHADHTSGDITCFNHGEFVFGDSTKQTLDWIESATFRLIDGKWRMNFLHITERYKTIDE